MRRAFYALSMALALGCTEARDGRVPGSLPPAAAPGPVPDFEPMAAVATHAGIAPLAPELPRTLARLLGKRAVTVGGASIDDDTLLWLRDYQPLWVRRDGGLVALRYLSRDAGRSEASPPPGWLDGVKVATLPLFLEHGNLVSTGALVLATERLVDDNRPRPRQEILDILAAGVSPARVVVLPSMPHEPTGHVDVFVLALDRRTVAVPRLDPEAVELVAGDRALAVAGDVQRFLDDRAAALAALGLEVVRPPMIAPAIAWASGRDESDERPSLVLFTPANTLLLPIGGRRLALVPGFAGAAQDERLAALARRYERSWRDDLAARGWETHVVDATELAGYGGLLRCATAVRPAR
jgi:hypothetical protein